MAECGDGLNVEWVKCQGLPDLIYCLESFHFILMGSLANNKFSFGVLEDALILP